VAHDAYTVETARVEHTVKNNKQKNN